MAQLYHWPVPCTICESPVEYHCNTCGDVLCSKCRENHLRSNAGRNHNVVPYSERIQPNKPSLQCGDHPGHQCGVWCKSCNRAACSECVTSDSHGGHRFLKLEEKLKEKRKEIQNQFDEYSSLLCDWQNSLQESEKKKAAYETDVKRLDREIVSRADEICRQVRTLEKETRKQLQEMKDASLRVLQDQQKAMTDNIQRLKGKIKLLEDILRNSDTSIILQGQVEEVENTKPSLDLPLQLPVFNPGFINVKVLQEMFGNLSHKTAQIIDSNPVHRTQIPPPFTKLAVESIININKAQHTPAVACVGPDQAWVRTTNKKLQLVNRQNEVKKTINIDFDIYDMDVTPQGDILLPDYTNNCIRTMTMEGKIKKLFTTKEKPQGICCLPSGDIVVTFIFDKRVVQYSNTGKVIKEMDKSLFECPWYVAHSQVNQQLYVCDKSSSYKNEAPGRILVLAMTGALLYTYTGPDPETFAPLGLCTDQAGHVLITDISNNSIHILDKGGNFLQYLLTKDTGLTNLITIDVDCEGYVWIGEWNTGEMKVVKYMQRK